MVRDGMLIVLEAWEGGPNYAQYKVMDVKTGSGIVLQQEMAIADDYLGMQKERWPLTLPSKKKIKTMRIKYMGE